MDSQFSVTLGEIQHEFELEILCAPDGFERVEIRHDDVNRPALQLTGYFDYFDTNRIQIMGKVESAYVESLPPDRQRSCLEALFATRIPCLIITRGIELPPVYLELAEKYGVPLMRTHEYTAVFTSALIAWLKVMLAPRITCHGVLVEVYGEGVLILGDSGVGKSETAIELVKRGHRLIADDAVEIKRVSQKTLVGTAPDIIRYLIELRGIGIIDVRRIFGMGAVKMTENINLVINLEQWVEGKQYDRLGADNQYFSILDIEVPSLTIPVKPGRNLAVIIEVAAMNNRHKKMGYNAAQELSDRLYESMGGK